MTFQSPLLMWFIKSFKSTSYIYIIDFLNVVLEATKNQKAFFKLSPILIQAVVLTINPKMQRI